VDHIRDSGRRVIFPPKVKDLDLGWLVIFVSGWCKDGIQLQVGQKKGHPGYGGVRLDIPLEDFAKIVEWFNSITSEEAPVAKSPLHETGLEGA
jgi:hypothetical protein